MKKEIDWEKVDKDSEICLKKYENFEKDLKRIKKNNKSLKQMNDEVNKFCKTNNIETYNLKIKK